MTMTQTQDTFAIRDRARAALAKGHSFRYGTPGKVTVTIEYTGGGSFVTVQHRDADRGKVNLPSLVMARTYVATDLMQALQLFTERVAMAAVPVQSDFNEGVTASIAVLDKKIKAVTAIDPTEPALVALRHVRADLLALLQVEGS